MNPTVIDMFNSIGYSSRIPRGYTTAKPTEAQSVGVNYSVQKEARKIQPQGTVNVYDVAAYILSKFKAGCTTMKLHKLLYYCQAWSLVWDEKPLFNDPIEAWANGPVVRTLYNMHKGVFVITYNQLALGNKDALTQSQKETVNAVLDYYGKFSSQYLVELTHAEDPWKQARKGLMPQERGNNIIPLSSMAEYYSSLK